LGDQPIGALDGRQIGLNGFDRYIVGLKCLCRLPDSRLVGGDDQVVTVFSAQLCEFPSDATRGAVTTASLASVIISSIFVPSEPRAGTIVPRRLGWIDRALS